MTDKHYEEVVKPAIDKAQKVSEWKPKSIDQVNKETLENFNSHLPEIKKGK